MSMSAMVQSAKAGKERMSFTSPRVKPKLPAPMKAIFFMRLSSIVLNSLGFAPLFDMCSITLNRIRQSTDLHLEPQEPDTLDGAGTYSSLYGNFPVHGMA